MLRVPALALIVLVSILAFTGSANANPTFDPYFEAHFSVEPQAPTDLTLKFGLRNPSDAQFAAIVFYIPRDWGVARGDAIPVGTKLGTLSSLETLGLINSPCNTPIPVEIDLMNASLDSTDTVSFEDLELKRGDLNAEGLGTRDYAEDKDGNTLLDAIDHYPDFLSEGLGGAQPITRLAGVNPVAGVPILIQFLIFPPGSRFAFPNPEIARWLNDHPESGYPMIMVVQKFDTFESRHEPGPITDHCSPRDVAITISSRESRSPLLVSPQDGSYFLDIAAFSKRDPDGDALDNSIDVCPFNPNAGDIRLYQSGDQDNDGLDLVCDPNDDPESGGTNSDHDGDGYLNRQDNCPLVKNGQRDDTTGVFLNSPMNQSDQDFDNIGDVCEPNPTVPDGEMFVVNKSVEVVIGDPLGSGGPPSIEACPHCYRPGEATAEAESDEGADNQLAVAIGLIALGAGAGAVMLGGGAAYLMRRRRG